MTTFHRKHHHKIAKILGSMSKIIPDQYMGYELDQDNRERAISFLINEYTKLTNPEPIEDLGDLDL